MKKQTRSLPKGCPSDFPSGYEEIGSRYYKFDEESNLTDVRGFFGNKLTDWESMLPLIQAMQKKYKSIAGMIEDIDTTKVADYAYNLLYYATSLGDMLGEICWVADDKKDKVIRLRYDDVAKYIANVQTYAKYSANEMMWMKDEIAFIKRTLAKEKGGTQ